MTDTFGVQVLALEPERRRVRLRVTVLCYDADEYDRAVLDEDSSFFLRVLRDEADTGPLGEHVSVDQICDRDWVDANTWLFIDGFMEVANHNVPFTADDIAALPTIHGMGSDWFTDEDRLVQGDYDVWVTDGRWLTHLSLGQCWTTAAYPSQADTRPREPDAPRQPSPYPMAAHSQPCGSVPEDVDPHLNGTLIRSLTEASDPLTAEELDRVRESHRLWLRSGGGYAGPADAHYDSRWRVFNAVGYAMAVFTGSQGTDGVQACLRNRRLTGLDLHRLDLPWADLTAVAAGGVNLSGANLCGSYLTDSHLPGVDLSGADLTMADLSRSDLRGANLRGADLVYADFENADLTGADLTGARISAINLAGARVQDIRGFGARRLSAS